MKNFFRIVFILSVISLSSCKDDFVDPAPYLPHRYLMQGFITADTLKANSFKFYLDEVSRLCNFWDNNPQKTTECIMFNVLGHYDEGQPFFYTQPALPDNLSYSRRPKGLLNIESEVLADTLVNIRVMTNEDTGLGLAADRDVTNEFDVLYDDPYRIVQSNFKDYDGPDAYKDANDTKEHGPYAFIRTSLERFNETVHPYNSVSMALLPKAESNLDKARSLTIIATLGTYKGGRKQFSCVYNAQASTD